MQTTRLIANFDADLREIARQCLEQHWESPETISDQEILIHYFDSLRRCQSPRPRRIRQADNFACPQEFSEGWDMLRNRVVKGDDVSPHLSLRHASLFNLDGLLNEWNVHHFHLGVKPHDRNPRLRCACQHDPDRNSQRRRYSLTPIT